MLGFLGGTGEEGKGLAFRLALAGESVMIGSRDAARAVETAQEVNDLLGRQVATGADNFQTADYLFDHGMIDIVVHRKNLKNKIYKILKFMEKN